MGGSPLNVFSSYFFSSPSFSSLNERGRSRAETAPTQQNHLRRACLCASCHFVPIVTDLRFTDRPFPWTSKVSALRRSDSFNNNCDHPSRWLSTTRTRGRLGAFGHDLTHIQSRALHIVVHFERRVPTVAINLDNKSLRSDTHCVICLSACPRPVAASGEPHAQYITQRPARNVSRARSSRRGACLKKRRPNRALAGVIRAARIAPDCLHRFCAKCIERSLRSQASEGL